MNTTAAATVTVPTSTTPDAALWFIALAAVIVLLAACWWLVHKLGAQRKQLQALENLAEETRSAQAALLAQVPQITQIPPVLERLIAAVDGAQSAAARAEAATQHAATTLGQQLAAHIQQQSADTRAARQDTQQQLEHMRGQLHTQAHTARQEISSHVQALEQSLAQRLHQMAQNSELAAEQLRTTLNERLAAMQADNGQRLEQMRRTVDEKLHETLETRLGQSFALVSQRLELVHKGLGEMQSLAGSVGDLKRVMTNVKTRGTWGEVQLGAIIESVLAPHQWARNVCPVPGRAEVVEFAIRLPGAEGSKSSRSKKARSTILSADTSLFDTDATTIADDAADNPMWLPIDAKYPIEHYQRLQEAEETGDRSQIQAAAAAFEASIRAEAKKIASKYIAAPHTTDFAIMYLPSEGLFAEVLRRAGLIEALQTQHRVTVTGPANLAAMLNSLQMGFRTLAIEQRSSQVWAVLGEVKTEFGKFGDIVAATQRSIEQAARKFDQVGVRTRAIERKLRDVEALPDPETSDSAALPAQTPSDTAAS